MNYNLLADAIVLIHFAWILLMIIGFLVTLYGFRKKEIFDWLAFRVVHFLGIVYVGLLALMGKYCPLTAWENALRLKSDPALSYTGSFMIHYVEKLVYPDINPWLIRIPTTIVACLTVLFFILRPPKQIKRFFKRPG